MFQAKIKVWLNDQSAIAAVESALVFPILMIMLLGTFDMGNAILTNQKTIRASQVVADLVTRAITLSNDELDEAIQAGGLSFQPYSSANYGIDIISLRFDDDGDPEILWRETRNMEPVEDVMDRVAPLSDPNTGVVVVAAEYTFEPVFAGFVMDELPMQEVAFAKGRRSSIVCLDDVDC
jgi:hypothetical protein